MGEMVCAALVQEAVTRGVSFGFTKREEKTSQGDYRERLEMAANELEFALERTAKLHITDLSLIQRRKMIKCAYVEARELLGQQEEDVQKVKRRRFRIINAAKSLATSFLSVFKNDDVRRLEWYADCAGKFVRDVESGCSLSHYTFCNPLVRRLLEGKTLRYRSMEQGNRLRSLYIWPMCSEERGVEALLQYFYEDGTLAEKSFVMSLIIRLSESTDLAGVAIKCLQLLTSQFKLETEAAVGELALLANLQDVSHSHELPRVGIQEYHIKYSALCRPDPACCKASRIGLCADGSVSSELSHMLPEHVIAFYFNCYISAVEFSLRSSSVNRGWRAPLEVSVVILPHRVSCTGEYNIALEFVGNKEEVRDVGNRGWSPSIQQVAETVRSKATNCFFRQPELMEYRMRWFSKHGGAYFVVEKPSTGRTGAPKTSRRYSTRASTKRRR